MTCKTCVCGKQWEVGNRRFGGEEALSLMEIEAGRIADAGHQQYIHVFSILPNSRPTPIGNIRPAATAIHSFIRLESRDVLFVDLEMQYNHAETCKQSASPDQLVLVPTRSGNGKKNRRLGA